jgi:hypothetical protein
VTEAQQNYSKTAQLAEAGRNNLARIQFLQKEILILADPELLSHRIESLKAELMNREVQFAKQFSSPKPAVPKIFTEPNDDN